MASQEETVSTSGALEVAEQDLEKPSPSQSLLQRLKSLREWQERQREELMQVLAHTNTPREPILTPLKEETPRFSESVVKEDSTPPPHLVPHKGEDNQSTVGLPGVETATSVASTSYQLPVKPHENFPEEVETQPRLSTLREQLPDNHDSRKLDSVATRMRQANHPTQANETNEWQVSPLTSTEPSMGCDVSDPQQEECDERNVRENEYNTPHAADSQERTQDSYPASFSPQEDPSDFMNESMEDLFGLGKQKPYRSEKYESPSLPSKECLRKETTQSSQAVKNFAPSKSFFCSVTQEPDGSAEDVEETPKPRHRFLRKGEGTSRFGMRPMRLRMSKKQGVDESSCAPHAAIQSNARVPHTDSPSAVASTKEQFRLPMRTLKLQEVPQRAVTSMGERVMYVDQPVHGVVRCRASPVLAATQPTTRGPTSPLPDPLNLEKQQRKEEEELSAFEKLEELAEDSSFSSNSSTVWHLLRQGQQSVSSTPLRTPPPLALQETPVVGSHGMESKNLTAESHPVIGDLINRVLPSRNDTSPHQQQVAVDVKGILAQLKAIVRLEGHSISDVTESDIQSFLEGCSSQYLSDARHPTSTPAPPQPAPPSQARPHHVHFASEGVRVMEYELSDTEGEDTLTDAASLDSDLITTSDLEALTQLSIRGAAGVLQRQQQTEPSREGYEDDSSSTSEVTITEQEGVQGQEPVVLTFSPPPPRPPQSASNYIWSIFGKERDSKKQSAPKAAPRKAKKESCQHPPPKPQKIARSAPQPDPDGGVNQELEVHKTLLLAKVAELEKETKLFQMENSKLQRLQKQAQEERQNLEEEKCRLQEEVAIERRRFQEYVDRERNALWREKQQVIQKPAPVTQPQEHVMEMVHLREQIREMREEAERKESLNQFTVKKLDNRIKALENENKRLKEKNNSLQALEKENQDLRLKVDRARVGGRARPATQPTKPTRGRPKSGTRPTTVDGVAKTLERMTKPQPVVVKEVQSNPSKTKQDLANNNINLGATESDEVMLAKQRSNTRAESSQASTPTLKDTPVTVEGPTSPSAGPPMHNQASLPLWASLGCTEEAGLEHTERVREDGIREVIYANGNRKEIHPSGEVTISFYNGDRKEIHADRTVYVYGSDHTSHTTYSNGMEELVFPNGQRETRLPDGSSKISFPNGSQKSVLSDGTEICTTKDGSIVRTNPDGSQVFEFPSGQREVHRGGEKRREYPDGTVKILHPDGRTETRYSSGRIRIKDKEGNVILDTHVALSSP